VTSSTDNRVAECAECGRTSPLTSHGNGTPKGWAYIADAQVTLCPLHRPQRPQGWQDVMQTYSRAELMEQTGGAHKPPPPAGTFEEEEQ
jgi:hypothetical protein